MMDVQFYWAAACPFCHDAQPSLIDMGTDFWIGCRRCGANGPSGKNVPEALQRWNQCGVSLHSVPHDSCAEGQALFDYAAPVSGKRRG